MSGLLGDVLPYLYSRGNMLQRRLNGLLSDPVGTAQQAMGQAGDSMNKLSGLMDEAFANPRSYQPTNKNKLAELVGELQSGPLGFAPAGITAWHGTPHSFDKFDASKIGTGEGAQAYGHGLYLAEAPEVARSYVQAGDRSAPVVQNWLSEAADAGHTGQAGIDWAKKQISARLASAQSPRVQQTLSDALSRFEALAGGGNLYKVDLPDASIAKMLDWDKPLSQQPAVLKALKGTPLESFQQYAAHMTGGDMISQLGNSAEASRQLKALGIPGIRYLDGGSRGAGQGSSNFVVFPGEENALRILERNGQAVK